MPHHTPSTNISLLRIEYRMRDTVQPMKIGVIHNIADAESFEESGMAMVEKMLEGIKNHQACISTDGTEGMCVWEGKAVDEVSQFIDTALGNASKQKYFEIHEDVSVGVPG